MGAYMRESAKQSIPANPPFADDVVSGAPKSSVKAVSYRLVGAMLQNRVGSAIAYVKPQ
jgi:hypothetical protein